MSSRWVLAASGRDGLPGLPGGAGACSALAAQLTLCALAHQCAGLALLTSPAVACVRGFSLQVFKPQTPPGQCGDFLSPTVPALVYRYVVPPSILGGKIEVDAQVPGSNGDSVFTVFFSTSPGGPLFCLG